MPLTVKSYETFNNKDKEEQNVCRNQQTFNRAFQKAVDNYTIPAPSSQAYTAFGILCIIYIIFLCWALVIAIKKKGPNKTLNILFAIILSPAYVLSDLISSLNKEELIT